MSSRPLLIAHRGASWAAPENTLAAAELAWQEGADAVEADFRLTADGRLVAIHDESTLRVSGVNLPVAETTLGQLRRLDVGAWNDQRWTGQRLATLDEMLATTPPDRQFVIEIKCGAEAVGELARVLRSGVISSSRVSVISYDREVLSGLRQRLPEPAVLLVARFEQCAIGWQPSAEELVKIAHDDDLDGLSVMACDHVDADFVRTVKAAGLTLWVWTVDDPNEAQRLIAAGLDALTTNRPGWLREQLAG
ncbi:MAG: glycerophosphodiester phosphodiesterase [Planctomycetes bacterium]|nr:glycerophosphodiester phosphodiesterase [Planctomycetota bacterium]